MSHENNSQQALRRLRRDARDEEVTVVGYENESGKVLAWTGDDDAPYVKLIPGSGGGIAVVGLIAHDAADNEATNFPVKIGGHANSGVRDDAVDQDDVADVSVDLNGRVRVRLSGTNEATTVPADIPLDSANALQVGGQTGHDEVDQGYPIKIGGHARNETPAQVATDDRVDGYYTRESRLVNVQDLGWAGEDLVNEVVRTVPGALAVEEHSLDQSYLAGSATNAVVKATAGRVYQIIISNNSGATLYFQLHNLAAAPGGGAVPVMSPIPLLTGGTAFIDFGEYGFYCSVGITVGSSLVFATFTGLAGLHITTLFK